MKNRLFQGIIALLIIAGAPTRAQAAPSRNMAPAYNVAQEILLLRDELKATKQLVAQHEEMLRTLVEQTASQQDILEAQQRHLISQWNDAKKTLDDQSAALYAELMLLGNNMNKLSGQLLTFHEAIEKQNQVISHLQGSLQQITTTLQRHDSNLNILQGAMIALTEATAPSPVTSLEVEHAKEGSYVVKVGDTLSTIAKKFNITLKDLRSKNQLPNDKIFVGQKLSIPARKSYSAYERPSP